MAAAALIGYATLLAFVFGVRTVRHRRRTGESGWLRPLNRAEWLGDGLFTIGVVAAVIAPVLQLAGSLHPVGALDSVAANAAGTALLVAGSAVAVVAQAELGTAWRAGIDASGQDGLLMHGLYRVVRHPFYLGMMTATVGVAAMTPNLLALLGAAALITGCEVDARRVEEPALQAVHGDAYRSYTARTPRFVPNPFRRTAPEARPAHRHRPSPQ